ncbi:16S rRNA (cytosine(1402)-N(4))-methyltransferase RsmH [bacterium NHP-B]|nr:16S rRNA (cytosine(1402)-N(4))-methyltransferase RsmH [bacterium NHP-B]
MTHAHTPVMKKEVMEKLSPLSGMFLDATFGRGGYTQGILESKHATVIALDRDQTAIDYGRTHFHQALETGRLCLHHARFSTLSTYVHHESLDGAVFDLGLSSPQVDEAKRGFSFSKQGPLDMDMGLSQKKASDLLNTGSEKEIARILFQFGEERRSRQIARKIVDKRRTHPFQHTQDVTSLFEGVPHKPGTIHPATRTFQALRLWVNEELEELTAALTHITHALRPGGRFVCVSFHSLEDRLVKQFLKPLQPTQPSRHVPQSLERPVSPFRVPPRQPQRPQPEEIAHNPRARSAKLRWAIREMRS